MADFDLLQEKTGAPPVRYNEEVLSSLGFESAGAHVFAGAEGAGKSFFAGLLSAPARAEEIAERQRIYRDFDRYPGLAPGILERCAQSRRGRPQVSIWSGKDVSLAQKHSDGMSRMLLALDVFDGLRALLEGRAFSSLSLGAMARFFCEGDFPAGLRALLDSADFSEAGGAAALDAALNDELCLGEAKLVSARRASSAPRGMTFPLGDHFLRALNAEELYARAGRHMCASLSKAYSGLNLLYASLAAPLAFYKGARQFIKSAEALGLPTCLPEVGGGGISARGLCDGALAFAEARPARNSLELEKGKIAVVTGPAMSGKTSFVRGLGMAAVMALAGLPVFAEGFCLPVFRAVSAHFPREEDETLSHGKLEEELRRMKSALSASRENALLILNDSFETTTAQEGVEIASGVLRALSEAGATVLFASHLEGLSPCDAALTSGADFKVARA